jgi:predicted peptidase
MRKLLIISCILFFKFSFSQSYDELLNKAGQELQKKEYCKALTFFKSAFTDSVKVGTYDYAYGALAAANCNDEKLALIWLKKSQKMGLGLNNGEAEYIANDPGFEKLHSFKEWNEVISEMKNAVAEKQALQIKKIAEWKLQIKNNAILKKSQIPKSGFALYFTKVDSIEVPYLVYIPKSYNSKIPSKATVYLHGGIVNAEKFDFENPEIATGEPIFSVGATFNSIIIYPFGKKDFGWVSQKKPFENILTIVKNVQGIYNINKNEMYLGGMSNGGTAAFWFASQKPNIFKGFYAFSALPKLEISDIDFTKISQNKPFYSINTKDDGVFKYDEVLAIYTKNKSVAKGWNFETLETGNHGFIYEPKKGIEIMNAMFKKLFKE